MSIVMWESVQAWWPELTLSIGALVVLIASVCTKRTTLVLGSTWVVLFATGMALWQAPVPARTDVFFGLILCDSFSLVFRWLALGTVALVIVLASASRDLAASAQRETWGLILLIGVGLMLMAEANHLLMAYVAMEFVSLTSYLLVGFLEDRRSAEAGLKYLLFGALSSGIMLFGMSLLFALTGQLAFPNLLRTVTGLPQAASGALLLAVAFILAGVAFKVSMVPFHLWTPDAYEGAPVAVTALLSVGPKAAGLALFLRFLVVLQPIWSTMSPVVILLTIVTMTLGNVVALAQTNIKRLFAYSTIGQVGYLLIGLAVNTQLGLQGLLFYLVAYFVTNLGAFACIVAVVNETRSEALEAFKGLSGRAPGLALGFTVFLLSLTGIPPLIGFFGKFLLFGSAIASQHPWLAIAGAVNSAIALYYYVNIIRLMYVAVPERREPMGQRTVLRVAVGFCAVVVFVLGLFPGLLLKLLDASLSINLL